MSTSNKLKIKNLALKKKLIIAFLILGLMPMLIAATVITWQSGKSLEKQVYNQLDTLRASKKLAIEDYATNITNQVLTLSTSSEIIEGVKEFQVAFDSFMRDSNNLGNVSASRKELANYYQNEFLPAYKDSNKGESYDVDKVLSQLSDEAVLLQNAYINNNPASLGSKHELDASPSGAEYDRIHARVHPGLRDFLEAFGYYDIFLIDSKKGRVVYSVYKELDYATSWYG
jgi:methyl-accepting chemotaxis protein